MRLVLGARPGDVLRMIVRQGASLVGAGLALGGVIALAAGGLLSSLLFEVRPRDPVVLAVVFVTLGAGGLVAILVPSLRATRVDPVRALRNE